MNKKLNFENSDIKLNDIYLWSENPRFTNQNEMKFDFYVKKESEIINSILKSLIKIDRFIDLLEDIVENGFKNYIDEIILYKKNNVFYVLEGNRRILSLFLIFNLRESREICKNFFNSSKMNEFKKIKSKLDEYDRENSFGNYEDFYLTCKVINEINNDNKIDLMNLLNSRHFGNRKGKENWSRGSVLKAIYDRSTNYLKTENINKSKNDLLKHLENYFGKKMTSTDLHSAIWCCRAIEKYNEYIKFGENKLLFFETDDGISENSDTFFSISSLELCLSSIEIHMKDCKNLGSYLNIKYDWENLNVNYSEKISETMWQNLIIFLIDSIKLKKLTTRGLDFTLEKKLQNILTLKDYSYEHNNSSKILKYDDLTFNNFQSINEKELNLTNKQKKSFQNFKIFVKQPIDNIKTIIDELIEIDILSKIDNPILKSIVYLWINDFKNIHNSRADFKIDEYFFTTTSLFIRIIYESLSNFLVVFVPKILKMFCQKYESISEDNENKKKFQNFYDNCNNNYFYEKIINEYNYKYSGIKIINFINSEISSMKYDISSEIFNYIFKNEIDKIKASSFLDNEKEEIKKSIANALNGFFSYFSYQKDFNFHEINRFVHNSHYILEILSNEEKKERLQREFNSCINWINNFLKALLKIFKIC